MMKLQHEIDCLKDPPVSQNIYNLQNNTWMQCSQLNKVYNVTEVPTLQYAKALYNTSRFKEAQQITNLLKGDEVNLISQQIILRLQEEQGIYNMNQLYERQQKEELLNVGNYFNNNIEVKTLDIYGRSIVSKSDIKIGTILTVEKAFMVGNLPQMEQLINTRLSAATIAEQKAYKDLKGDNMHQKYVYNIFAQGPQLNSLNQPNTSDSDLTAALMLTQSIYNHSCIPNAKWHFIGDVMFVVASQDIKANQQIFLRYSDIEPDRFMQTYGFKCQCQFCQLQSNEQQIVLQIRESLTNDQIKYQSKQCNMKKSDVDALCIYQRLERAEKILLKCKDGSARKFLASLYQSACYIYHLCMETFDQAYYLTQKSIDALGINSKQLLSGSFSYDQNSDFGIMSISQILNYARMTMNSYQFEQSKLIVKVAGQIFNLLTGLEMKEIMKEKLTRMSLI
ncbi:SET_domain-containing protein [Hexamita inflata]|uniref:SET domain-containing protein n=1 Tax=Hexamita inflata TaxID=28002 RepID=A0AA86QEI8_9EUKA|nr:SET domain-containing protein [Hexamita inflata]